MLILDFSSFFENIKDGNVFEMVLIIMITLFSPNNPSQKRCKWVFGRIITKVLTFSLSPLV